MDAHGAITITISRRDAPQTQETEKEKGVSLQSHAYLLTVR